MTNRAIDCIIGCVFALLLLLLLLLLLIIDTY